MSERVKRRVILFISGDEVLNKRALDKLSTARTSFHLTLMVMNLFLIVYGKVIQLYPGLY